MKYTDRVEKAISQVIREIGWKYSSILSPVQTPEYWVAVQKAEKDFDVSGVKIDMIIQGNINNQKQK